MRDTETLNVAPLVQHFAELRKRLLWCMIAIICFFFCAFSFSAELINLLAAPLRSILGEEYLPGFKDVAEPFMVSLRVSFLTAVILASPLWFYQIWRFLEPALYIRERRWTLLSCIFSWLLFWLGILFCFLIILPFTLGFLIDWGQEFAVVDLTLRGYVSFLTLLLLGFGLIFQLPLVLIWLSLLELIQARDLRKARRYVILACFVVSALLTPPDWISQVGMAVPIYILYELAALAVLLLERKRSQDAL